MRVCVCVYVCVWKRKRSRGSTIRCVCTPACIVWSLACIGCTYILYLDHGLTVDLDHLVMFLRSRKLHKHTILQYTWCINYRQLALFHPGWTQLVHMQAKGDVHGRSSAYISPMCVSLRKGEREPGTRLVIIMFLITFSHAYHAKLFIKFFCGSCDTLRPLWDTCDLNWLGDIMLDSNYILLVCELDHSGSQAFSHVKLQRKF